MRNLFLTMALAISLLAALPAQAHKVVADAYASGDVIVGEIGFSTGDVAKNALVEVFDDAGNKLGETHTDEKGNFTFKPTQKVTHVFHSDLGGGHVANFKVAVEDLPLMGAPASGAAGTPAAPALGDSTGAAPAGNPAAAAAGGSALTPEQVNLIAETVRREVKPLRQVLFEYKEKEDVQSILGGIGFIIGLFGVGFYMAARRKLKQG